VTVPIPRSLRAHIIGKGGATIKSIQEKTGARIQMPKTDEAQGNFDDDDEATVDVIIEGNSLSAEMARQQVQKIVDERTATSSQKLRGIPIEFYPFIAGPNNAKVQALEEGKDVRVHIPVHHSSTAQKAASPPASTDLPITLSGDRAEVQAVRAAIESHVQELRNQLRKEQVSINTGRHQYIIGDRGVPAHEFLADTGCAIVFPSDPEDEFITIVGPSDRLQAGADRAMDLASSMHFSNLDVSSKYRSVPGELRAPHARNVTRYLQRRNEVERLEKLYNAHIVTPILSEGAAPWELYSRDGKNTMRATTEITNILSGHPPSRMTNVQVDPFFHQHIRKEVSPKVQQSYGVHTVVPDDSESDSTVLLVFEGPLGVEPNYEVPRTVPSAAEVKAFQSALEQARDYVLSIIEGQEQIASETIDVPQKFHEKLRKFIKKEQQDRPVEQIPVRVTQRGTAVTLRGTLSAVEGLAAKVNAWVEQETEDEKERGFTLSFDFPQKLANMLIGKGGSNIRELRDKFDVDIQVDNGKVVLTGPQKKAEAAKSHITNLGKQWADETSHVLKIDPSFHASLIGGQGKNIHALQDRYKVQINFPHGGRPARDDQSVGENEAAAPKNKRRNQAEDEVLVRGPSKGADGARDEILSLLQYLKDNSHSATVTVQQSYIPQIIGQGGRGVDELRQLTGAKIDLPGSRDAKDPSGLVEIQIKGTKTQVAQAKKLLEEKKSVYDKTVQKTLEVDKKHHRALIGASGSKLREIVVNAGGSDDRRELARTVQFPRAEGDGNLIKIEGDQDVVDKIIAAMNEIIAQRDSEVVETIHVPIEQHRSLIGRGGETKKALESKLNVFIDIPRQGDGKTDVKIRGQPAEVEKAKAHILDLIKGEEGEVIQIPLKYHHVISENGQFFRKLKGDHQVTVDHAGHKLPAKPTAPSNTRANGGALPLITDEPDESGHSWNIVSNFSSDLEGDIPWVLRGPPENVPRAKAQLAAALEQAEKNTNTGYLILPDPRTYRFVIGQGGSNVNSIRKATGCKITVPKDQSSNEAIQISGSAEGVEQAKELVLQSVRDGISNSGR
jgi:polyribonucleotide nucleotidyltransferase